MFARPRFAKQPSVPGIPNIHNDPTQIIQGGVVDEHYHLSGNLYNYLINIAQKTAYSEPIMTKGGSIMTSLTGDIMMVLRNKTQNFIPVDVPKV